MILPDLVYEVVQIDLPVQQPVERVTLLHNLYVVWRVVWAV